MKHFFFFFAVLTVFAGCRKDEPLPVVPPDFEKFYGGAGDDVARAVVSWQNEYFIAGTSNSGGNGGNDFFLLHTDSLGNQKSWNYYGGAADETCWGMSADNSGNFYIAGYTNSSGNGGNDVYVVSVNSSGNINWTHTYGGPQDDMGYSIRCAGSQLIVTGATRSFGSAGEDAWVLCINAAAGDTAWTRRFGGAGDEGAMNSCASVSAAHCIVGYSNSSGSGSTDGFKAELDASGNIVQQNYFGTNDYDEPHAVVKRTDLSGYFVTGHYGTLNIPTHNVFATDIRSDATVNGFYQFGGAAHDGAEAATWLESSQTLGIAARSNSRAGFAEDIYLAHVNADGSLRSEKWIGTDSDDAAYGLLVDKTGWMVCGTSRGGQGGGKDVYFLRTQMN